MSENTHPNSYLPDQDYNQIDEQTRAQAAALATPDLYVPDQSYSHLDEHTREQAGMLAAHDRVLQTWENDGLPTNAIDSRHIVSPREYARVALAVRDAGLIHPADRRTNSSHIMRPVDETMANEVLKPNSQHTDRSGSSFNGQMRHIRDARGNW